ncbi:hypothetical protein HFRIS_017487 [Herbaspirillum frisingense GSF30]|uniref:DUF4153 domain-containing protein n=1 Tax=Herbaspirillum frisingense GSF30 TaxID=864073 RepID=A0AAI9IC49_9BURK|nr:DUF4153 domain-containing protein [Herbaspirillum frisingense]EOA03461.1 hypothetical protein HFRIS_017487 [Herbaspirillum frisingense GSF30]
MTTQIPPSLPDLPSSAADRGDPVATPPKPGSIGTLRLAIGLAQGVVLYVLYRHWSDKTGLALHPTLFRCVLLLALFLPPIAISSLSHMQPRKLALWLLLLAAIISSLAFYDIWRTDIGAWLNEPALSAWQSDTALHLQPSLQLVLLMWHGLFIAQAMALAAHQDQRWIASYPSYFAWAWKLVLQAAFACLFNAALWIILMVGAALFALFSPLFLAIISSPWFFMPVTALAYAGALHLTDVKPAIIANLRKLLLTMLSWLLPLAVLIAAGFLAGLCVTGLQPLWETRRATAVLLGTTALLVVLANMVYQDGLSDEAASARLIRWSLRVACALPLPLVVLAACALGLRVSQYGWTPERVCAALCIAVASIYAIGYLAALWRAARMVVMAPVNVAASFTILAVSVAVLTPLADPARLAVADQLARLRSGQITPERLDVRFMRYHGQRYGVQALADIVQIHDPRLSFLHQEVQLALQTEHAFQLAQNKKPEGKPGSTVRMHPEGSHLPAAIVEKTWDAMEADAWVPGCLRSTASDCDAYLVKPPGARREQVLIIDGNSPAVLLAEDAQGQWQIIGTFRMPSHCVAQLREALEGKTLQWKASPSYDLQLGDTLIPMVPASPRRKSCGQ